VGYIRQVRQVTEQDQIKALLLGKNLRAYLWTVLCEAGSLRDVGRFDENLGRLQDLDYFIRFVLKGGVLVSAGGSERYECSAAKNMFDSQKRNTMKIGSDYREG